MGTGSSTSAPQLTPVQLNASNVKRVIAGERTTFALTSKYKLYGWGTNDSQQLGSSVGSLQTTPVLIDVSPSTAVSYVAAGTTSTAVVQSLGVWAWGSNLYGQNGNGSTSGTLASPTKIIPEGSTATGMFDIVKGANHTLAMDAASNSLWAWGLNTSGQLGDKTTTNRATKTRITVNGSTSGVIKLAAAENHSFVVQNNNLYAFGNNSSGQLGLGNKTSTSTPTRVTGLPAYVKLTGKCEESTIDTGRYSTFAVLTNNTVWAWGGNTFGQLGTGDMAERLSPVQIWPFTPPATSTIDELKIDGYTSVIDDTANTITFTVPDYALDEDGRLSGTITALQPDPVTFVVNGDGSADKSVNDSITFGDGDMVYADSDNQYTLVLVSEATTSIKKLSIGIDNKTYSSVIDHGARTITFTVPEHAITLGGVMSGKITELLPADAKLTFVVGGTPYSYYGVGDSLGFQSGDSAYIGDDGIEYDIVIAPLDPPEGNKILEIAINGYEGVIDQSNKTVTFAVPDSQLSSGRLVGHLTMINAENTDFVVFIHGGAKYPRAENDYLGVGNGDKVYASKDVVYDIKVNPAPTTTFITVVLENRLNEAKTKYSEAEHTPDSWAALQVAIASAEAVLLAPESQQQIDDEVAKLQAVMGALVLAGDGEPSEYTSDDPLISWPAGINPQTNAYETLSANPNATITFEFTGTGISYYGTKNSNRAIVEIFIDGVSQGTVDPYASSISRGQLLFSISGLSSGPHTIQIKNTGTTSGTNTQMGIEKFVVQP